MSIDTARTITTWILVLVLASGAVVALITRRLAVRVLAVAIAGMVALLTVAVRQSIADVESGDPAAVCAGQATVLGITLTGGRNCD